MSNVYQVYNIVKECYLSAKAWFNMSFKQINHTHLY